MRVKLSKLVYEKHKLMRADEYYFLFDKLKTFCRNNRIKAIRGNSQQSEDIVWYEFDISDELYLEFKLRFL